MKENRNELYSHSSHFSRDVLANGQSAPDSDKIYKFRSLFISREREITPTIVNESKRGMQLASYLEAHLLPICLIRKIH